MPAQLTQAAAPNSKSAAALRRQAKVDAEQQAQALALEAFNTNRLQIWQGLFAQASRLALCVADTPEVRQSHSWWFGDFKVDARAESFATDGTNGRMVTKDTLTVGMAEALTGELAQGQRLHDEFVEAAERARREKEALAARKNEVLAKLSDEERKLLNLPSKYVA